MNIFLVLTAVSLISGVSILSGTTLYTQTSFNTAVMESNTIEDTKNNEMIVAELLSDGSIYVANQGQKNSTIVKLEIFDGTTTEYSTIFGNDIPGWEGVTITENDTTIQPLGNMTLVESGVIDASSSLTGYVTTAFGNIIKMTNNYEDSDTGSSSSSNSFLSSGTATQNAINVLNGFSINSLIFTLQEFGEMIYGVDTIGIAKTITPYTPVTSNTNFASVLKSTDTKNTYAIPEFWRQYSYNNATDTLTDVTVTQPNVLGYSASRTTTGSVVTTVSSNGITVSGTGEVILKLNNYQGQSLILRGDSGTGVIKIITSPIDLMTSLYTTGMGYLTHTGATTGLNVMAGIDSTHKSLYDYTVNVAAYLHRHNCKCSDHYHGAYSYTVYNADSSSTLTKTYNSDHTIITGHTAGGWNLRIYDTLPSIEKIEFSEGVFETNYLFPNEQTYLYVKPNGGTVTIKGETSVSIPIVSVSGLSTNTPYQISKDGWVGATGVTSSTGTITLVDSDVRFEGFTTQGGLLYLYPDSLTYTGPFTTVCLDTKNEEIFHVTDGIDQVCIPSVFVKLPIPFDVEINKIQSGTVTYDYLTGNYTAGSSVYVPVIAKMKTISFTLNDDINGVLNIADIPNTAQIKLFTSVTDSKTLYATGSAIENIEIGVTNTAAVYATHTGAMNADIKATVSADATFTINSDYTGSYEQTYDSCQAAMAVYGANNGCVQHGHPTDSLVMAALVAGQAALDSQLATHTSALEAAIIAQGPLTVAATVFKNGEYYNTIEIFDNLNPQFTSSSSLGLVSVQNANVVYSQTSGSSIISIPVEAGDYVEFVIHVGIVVSGIPTPVNSDSATVAGFASGTVTLHSGSVTATMG